MLSYTNLANTFLCLFVLLAFPPKLFVCLLVRKLFALPHTKIIYATIAYLPHSLFTYIVYPSEAVNLQWLYYCCQNKTKMPPHFTTFCQHVNSKIVAFLYRNTRALCSLTHKLLPREELYYCMCVLRCSLSYNCLLYLNVHVNAK